VNGALALLMFGVGVAIVIAATERLLRGIVGIAAAIAIAPFIVSVVLSGMEAENVAVGLAAGARGLSDVALGTAIGGAIFLLCIVLGVGSIVAPLSVRLPRSVVALVPAAALLTGLPILFDTTPRWTGVVLLLGFGASLALLVRESRGHRFLDDEEVREAGEAHDTPVRAVLWTVIGLAAIAVGGELVAIGADGLIANVGISAGFMGMVLTPVAVEAEEIIRQVLPTRRGYPDVAAGNAIGTVLWFTLFNLGLIALLTPVDVPSHVRTLDWPVLCVAATGAAIFLWRGRVGRLEGAILVGLGVGFAALHVGGV
jgi:cation:H+ antiporter